MKSLKILALFLLSCVVFGLMWWFMVGSQPRVLTDAERLQQANADRDIATAKVKAFENANPEVMLKVQSSAWKEEDGITYVVGVIVNASPHIFDHATVNINIYDESKNQVDTTQDSIGNFEPGTKWKFKAIVKNAKSGMNYKIEYVTGH